MNQLAKIKQWVYEVEQPWERHKRALKALSDLGDWDVWEAKLPPNERRAEIRNEIRAWLEETEELYRRNELPAPKRQAHKEVR